jgi:hypothetical protein
MLDRKFEATFELKRINSSALMETVNSCCILDQDTRRILSENYVHWQWQQHPL